MPALEKRRCKQLRDFGLFLLNSCLDYDDMDYNMVMSVFFHDAHGLLRALDHDMSPSQHPADELHAKTFTPKSSTIMKRGTK